MPAGGGRVIGGIRRGVVGRLADRGRGAVGRLADLRRGVGDRLVDHGQRGGRGFGDRLADRGQHAGRRLIERGQCGGRGFGAGCLGCGRHDLVQAQHDDRDVVVATFVFGFAHELAGDAAGVVDRRQDGGHSGLRDHRIEPVAAQQNRVAGPQLELAGVDLDGGFGAQGAAQDAALRVVLGGLAREVTLAQHLADQRVIVGHLHEGLVAPQIQAAVADVGELEAVVAQQDGGQGGAHAGLRPVGSRSFVDALVGGLRGLVQRDIGGEGGGHGLEGKLRGYLAGPRPAHAVGHRVERRCGDVGVFVSRPVQADVGQRRVSGG